MFVAGGSLKSEWLQLSIIQGMANAAFPSLPKRKKLLKAKVDDIRERKCYKMVFWT